MHLMRIDLPTLVLVGAGLVGCGGDEIIRLEVRAFLATEDIEFRATVRERCSGHDCYRGVHGFDIEARTPDGELVSLEERPRTELDGTYVAEAHGIAESYSYFIDDVEYPLESPAPYTATFVSGPDVRIEWDPPIGPDEEMRVTFTRDGGGGSVGAADTHVPLGALYSRPGSYHLVLHRERHMPLAANHTPSDMTGFVCFEREFDVVVE
jgi:hypothetical protein